MSLTILMIETKKKLVLVAVHSLPLRCGERMHEAARVSGKLQLRDIGAAPPDDAAIAKTDLAIRSLLAFKGASLNHPSVAAQKIGRDWQSISTGMTITSNFKFIFCGAYDKLIIRIPKAFPKVISPTSRKRR
jgi:hypothetical protein